MCPSVDMIYPGRFIMSAVEILHLNLSMFGCFLYVYVCVVKWYIMENPVGKIHCISFGGQCVFTAQLYCVQIASKCDGLSVVDI